MVQFTHRTHQSCGTAQRSIPHCRGARSCVRSTAVRCFKGGADELSNKPNSTLRLNFKIPYRVNYGQSLGLVGSGDSLGNWDPKRTVQMKWTDGDWWTVDLNVSPGGSLDLEYKYVVVNADGNIGYWKPGSNYRVTLPLQPSGAKVPKRIKVADAWDDSFKKVDIEEAESQATVSNSSSTIAPVQPAAATQKQLQPEAQEKGAQQPSAALPPSCASAATLPPAVSPPPLAVPAPPPAAVSQPPPTAVSLPPPPIPVLPPAAAAASPPLASPVIEPAVSTNSTPPSSQTPAGTQASPQASSSQSSGTAKPPSGSTPPRATSPRTVPPNFAAVTTIPVIHPSLLAEQERLEDGVRNSLEDLQTQMDKHQQLRDRIEDPAAVEIIVADRIVAAANNRVVAYNKALKAVQDYNRLPPSASSPKEAASDSDK